MKIENSIIRRGQRVLAMVHELHKQGYQNLGVYTGMSSSGAHWRCYLTPCSDFYIDAENNQVYLINYDVNPHYSTGESGNCYFNWDDAKQDNSRQLAIKFIERFPRLIEQCKGTNFEYAGWLTYMLGISETGALPVMYREYYEANKDKIRTTEIDIDLITPPHDKIRK